MACGLTLMTVWPVPLDAACERALAVLELAMMLPAGADPGPGEVAEPAYARLEANIAEMTSAVFMCPPLNGVG
ncbi:MAG TPA: hypothetical protein VHE37_11035 [Nevskiaceae bacterium]|nr:hypothetical protein [Nevskiaceae bacterium]